MSIAKILKYFGLVKKYLLPLRHPGAFLYCPCCQSARSPRQASLRLLCTSCRQRRGNCPAPAWLCEASALQPLECLYLGCPRGRSDSDGVGSADALPSLGRSPAAPRPALSGTAPACPLVCQPQSHLTRLRMWWPSRPVPRGWLVSLGQRGYPWFRRTRQKARMWPCP